MRKAKSWRDAFESLCLYNEQLDTSDLKFPTLSLTDIVNVQPLSAPSGVVFHKTYIKKDSI